MITNTIDIQGLLWAFATVTGIRSLGEEEILTSRSNGIYFRQKPSLIPPKDYVAVYDQENVVIETLLLGLVSLGLMLVNVFSIIAAGTIVLKVSRTVFVMSLPIAHILRIKTTQVMTVVH